MTTTSVTYLASFGGGVVSFISPCVLPLVPAYLSVITGLDIAEVEGGSRRHLARIARDTGMFVAGFSVVFILLGLSATAVGVALRNHLGLLTRICGADWLQRGEISVKFIRPVLAEDDVTVAALESKDGYEVEARNQHGDTLMAGTARLRPA